MKRLALTLALAVAIVSAAFGGSILWGDAPHQAASSDGDSIIWGS